MLLRPCCSRLGISRTLSVSSRMSANASEKPFLLLENPLTMTDKSALKRSKLAEKVFLNTLFACQSGGGEKGAHKHVVVNKKVLVRERIRRILDDDSDFFEICPTAGLGLDYGDVPGAGTVTGVGSVRGHLILFIVSDGTLKGGTSFPITVTKSLRAQV
jgi:3-methylcrotonyl-CoA carboxylase beta subunit